MMRKTLTALMVIALVTSAFAGAVGTVAADNHETSDTNTTDTASGDNNSSSISAGQHLGVVISSQSTEIRTEFDSAKFRAEIESSPDKSAVARERAQELKQEITDLRNERDGLIDEFRAGNISKDEFLAQLSILNSKLDAKTGLVTQSEKAAQMNGVNSKALSHLRNNARNLSGGAVAAIAQNVAQTGSAQADIQTDKHGNVQAQMADGATVGLSYKVEGSENLSFDLSRDNGTLTVTVTNATGEVVKGATVEVNGRTVGTTGADGTVSTNTSISGDSEEAELEIEVEYGDESAKMEVEAKHVSDRGAIRELARERAEDFREQQKEHIESHKELHKTWDERHKEFHTEQEDNNSSENSSQTHEEFHQRMEEAHKEFHKKWKDSVKNNTPRNDDKKPETVPRPEQNDSTDSTEDETHTHENSSDLTIDAGADDSTVEVEVKYGDEEQSGVTITADGVQVGTTNSDGTITFEVSKRMSEDGEVTISAGYDGQETKTSISVKSGGEDRGHPGA